MSSRVITLFAEPALPRANGPGFVVSILVHATAFCVLLFGLRHTTRIQPQSAMERYTVRLLRAQRVEAQAKRSAGTNAKHPASESPSLGHSAGSLPGSLPSVPLEVTQSAVKAQTLVQPDAPPDLVLPKESQVPLVLLWSARNFPSKEIIPPPPQEAAVAKVRPSLARPLDEPVIADLKMSSTAFLSERPTLPPSTTVPVVVRGVSPIKQTPETASEQIQQPTPATIMSISDFQTQGPVAIPLANQVAQSLASEGLSSGHLEKSAGKGSGNPESNQNSSGAGKGQGGDRVGVGSGPVAKSGSGAGEAQAPEAGSSLGNESSVTRIDLPKDGRFGVVVVGSSVAEQYPETVGIWGSRLVYSVFLHVGLRKNWILQYSLPRADEAAAGGSAARPEAPWPYKIIRPHLDPGDYTSEAIIVHGFVDTAGRFERLGVVFPAETAPPKLLLAALQQWQFRPARQNGKIAAVEILLIIPEEAE